MAAYMVVIGTVHDREAFKNGYGATVPPLIKKFGGEYVVMAAPGTFEMLEGAPAGSSAVISKWPSVEAAKAFWNSPEYQQAIGLRTGISEFSVYLFPSLPGVA